MAKQSYRVLVLVREKTWEVGKKTVRAKVPTEQPRPSVAQGKRVRTGACDENESV